MKSLFLAILFSTLVFVASGQTKSKHQKPEWYYHAVISYSLDCGDGTSSQDIEGKDAGYRQMYVSFKKWVYPRKIKSFEIISLKRIYGIHIKENKFSCPVKYEPFSLFSTTSETTDSLYLAKSTFAANRFSWYGNTGQLFYVTSPDSNKIIQIHLYPSQLIKINDSTYSYKQIK